MTDVETTTSPRHERQGQRLADARTARIAIGGVLAQPGAVDPAIAAALFAADDAIESLEVLVNQLQTALTTRVCIEQAKGVRMAQGLTADEAFAELVAISQRTNRKVAAVAAEVIRDAQAASLGRDHG